MNISGFSLKNFRSDLLLMLVCMVAGLVVGLSVSAFHGLLKLSELWIIKLQQSQEILILFLIPLIGFGGGIGIGLLDHYMFKGISGEGFRGVVKAIAIENGVLRKGHALKAILTSFLSISTGGGAGREAPTVIMGAALASTTGRVLKQNPEGLRVLCGAGTAAAVSAIFNAPLGGIVFALEIIIGELDIRNLVYVVISTVTAMAVRMTMLGTEPVLYVPQVLHMNMYDYAIIPLVGVWCGLVSIYFVTSFRWTFQKTNQWLTIIHPVLRPGLGGLIVGSIVIFLPTMLETSYEPVNSAVEGATWWMIALFTLLLKPVSNAITLGSGGAGGSFAVALKVGAMSGVLIGTMIQYFIPETDIGLYALVCSGAVIAGVFYAPITGIMIIAGISHNYEILLPLLFCTAFATYVVHTMKLESFNPIQGGNLHI